MVAAARMGVSSMADDARTDQRVTADLGGDDMVDITIPSNHVFERIARDGAGLVARWLGFSEDRTQDVQLAVSEAVTNAIEHGNKEDASVKVGVRFLVLQDKLAIQVIDQGDGMPPDRINPDKPSLENKLNESEGGEAPRGLGIYLIQQLVDDVELQTDENGSAFTMWFNLGADAQQKRADP